MSHAVRARALFLCAVVLSGCYTYVPVERASVAPGEEVRVYVSRVGLAQLPEALATDRYVHGRLGTWDDATLYLQVPLRRNTLGYMGPDIRQDIEVPMAEVLDVERREFSRGRTAALVAGGVSLAAAGIAVITSDGGGSPDGDGPGPDVIRIPLFTLPIGH